MEKLNKLYLKYRDKMIEKFGRSFYHDPIMLSILALFGILLLGILFMIIFRIQPSDVETPLIYNVIYGVTSMGPWYMLYYYLGAVVLLGLLNLIISWSLFEKERLLSYLLGLSNIVIAIVMMLYIYNLTALIK